MPDSPLIGPVDAPGLHVMSYNIRRRMQHANSSHPDRWEQRGALVQRLLRAEHPALLGVQEAMPDQAEALSAGLGDRYRRLGYGRRPEKNGEGCPIYYDTRRLTLISWEQVALSATPGVPGSRSYGNLVPRIAVTALLRDRATDLEFLFVNTHLDHLSHKARMRSADQIRTLVAESGRPALVTGDFNADAGTVVQGRFTAGGLLRDSWTGSEKRLTRPWGTFPNYAPPRVGRKRIDWILATAGITVRAAAINISRIDGLWPSDHVPVQAVVELPTQPLELRPSVSAAVGEVAA
ncbi:MAG: endonuclease/exonuclease/phosphatase family protein [Microbacteriaceae bacterium]